jgi:hypothetical protein
MTIDRSLRAALAACAAVAALAACNRPAPARNAPADAASAPEAGVAAKSAEAAQLAAAQPEQGPLVTVWKSPTCGCCARWVDHMRAAGFRVEVHDTDALEPVKREHGVPGHLESCHTARVEGFTVEGHVPADVIRRLLRQRPEIDGIAVPGMPMGSPGMEGPRKDPYDVIGFSRNGETFVYESK